MEVFLVAYEDVGVTCDFGEDLVQFLLTALPERCAVVEVETDAGAVLLRGAGEFEAEAAGVRAEGADEAGEMYNLHSFLPEDALEVEVLHVQSAANLTGTVVPNARAAGAVSAVGHIDLMAVSPGTALLYLRAFEFHSAAAEIALDEMSERTAFHESGKDLHRQAEVRCDARDIGLGAGSLKVEKVAGVDGLSALGRNPEPHAGRYQEGVFAVLLEFDIHITNIVTFCQISNKA